jgi:hypothetical protein
MADFPTLQGDPDVLAAAYVRYAEALVEGVPDE